MLALFLTYTFSPFGVKQTNLVEQHDANQFNSFSSKYLQTKRSLNLKELIPGVEVSLLSFKVVFFYIFPIIIILTGLYEMLEYLIKLDKKLKNINTTLQIYKASIEDLSISEEEIFNICQVLNKSLIELYIQLSNFIAQIYLHDARLSITMH